MSLNMDVPLYFLYSKYSNACKTFLPVIQQLQPHFSITFVNIDHPESRQRLAKTPIKTVPSILVETPSQIMILENKELQDFVQKLFTLVQQQQQQPHQQQFQPPPPNQVSTIVDPSLSVAPQPTADLSFGSSLNSRLQPQQISGPPPPQPIISNQINSNQQQSASLSGQAMANQHMQQMTNVPPPQQQQQTTMIAGQQVLDESIMYQPAAVPQQPVGNTFSTEGFYTPDQITGNGASRNDGPQQKSSQIKSAAELAMRERELADQQFAPQRKV